MAVVLGVLASPQFHEYLSASPWASAVPELLVVHSVNDVQATVKVTLGAVLPAGSDRLTLRVVEAVLPQPSVVVSVIV